MGRIGQAVAHRLKAFGIDRVVYWGRKEKPGLKESMNADFVSFDELAKESDFVIACCALTPDTKEVFNYETFRKMKKNAVSIFEIFGGGGGIIG
jgi:glyoxylate/hydroxypyruvate reductase